MSFIRAPAILSQSLTIAPWEKIAGALNLHSDIDAVVTINLSSLRKRKQRKSGIFPQRAIVRRGGKIPLFRPQ